MTLRNQIIRLAQAKPELRSTLLPLLKGDRKSAALNPGTLKKMVHKGLTAAKKIQESGERIHNGYQDVERVLGSIDSLLKTAQGAPDKAAQSILTKIRKEMGSVGSAQKIVRIAKDDIKSQAGITHHALNSISQYLASQKSATSKNS